MSEPFITYEDDYFDEMDSDVDDEFESFDCHRDKSGECGKAGSEECEFDCPYRRLFGISN